MNAKELYEMKLHEEKELGEWSYVVRVPGGWIYQTTNDDYDVLSQVFIPWHNEFQPKE